MRIVGLFARVSSGKYKVGLVSLEDANVVAQLTLPAPRESESRQLSELAVRARQFMEDSRSDLAALRCSEARASQVAALRAEGVLMACAGALNLAVREVHGRGLWRPAGLTSSAPTSACVDTLCEGLAAAAELSPEAKQAAAAARVVALGA